MSVFIIDCKQHLRSSCWLLLILPVVFNYGLGRHIWDTLVTELYPGFARVSTDISPDISSYPEVLCGMGVSLTVWQSDLIAAIVFCAGTGFAKTSILVFYHRIFPTKNFRIAIWILIAYVAGYSAASVFVNIFSCDPVAASWDYELALTAHCINRPAFYFAQAALGIIADFATLIAPIPMMMKLQLPMRQKVGIAGLLMTGGLYVSKFCSRKHSLTVIVCV